MTKLGPTLSAETALGPPAGVEAETTAGDAADVGGGFAAALA
jgi:hypothetical protein